MDKLTRWRWRRRTVKEARLLAREARYVLRRGAGSVKSTVVEQVRGTLSGVEEARKSSDIELLSERLNQLDKLIDKHFSSVRKSTFREYVESIGIAVVIAMVLRIFVVEAFKIPSGSMLPTLEVGDHIFVNKFIYGLRIPLTSIKFFRHTPKRGEVIVFIYPLDRSKDYIKRIVALGGDTVSVRDGQVYVDEQPVERHSLDGPCRYVDREEQTQLWRTEPCRAFLEQADGTTYRVVHDVDGRGPPDFGPFKVPEGEVFVMGDNRFHSSDSRVWGTVPEDNIKGKALIVWWSSMQWFSGIRWARFFDLVHAKAEARPPASNLP